MNATALAIIGCGAVAELQYAPAIEALAAVDVVAVLDPSADRAQVLANRFPRARRIERVEDAGDAGAEVAIVASPANYHATQAIAAMEAGLHVLVEKPMAATVAEAEQMIDVSTRTSRLLGVGYFRRFFPTSRMLRDMIRAKPLGAPLRYSIAEGGPFGWAAVSATFFQRAHSRGGVLHDHGAHVVDLAIHWFGEPLRFEYEDDAAGGLETNCVLHMWHQDGVEGSIRLSREWVTANRNHFEFERGWVGWQTGNANTLDVGLVGCGDSMRATVCTPAETWGLPSAGSVGHTYEQCFTEQLGAFVQATRGERPVEVPGSEGVRSLRLIEQCYQTRKSMRTA